MGIKQKTFIISVKEELLKNNYSSLSLKKIAKYAIFNSGVSDKEYFLFKNKNNKLIHFFANALKIKNIKNKNNFLIKVPKKEISKENFTNKRYLKEYLIGIFLVSGFINSPQKDDCHLEISFKSVENAKKIISISENKKLFFKISKRKSYYIIYLKRSEYIVNLLFFLGANNSALYFKNVYIKKNILNKCKHIQNTDLANFQKTIKTAKNDIQIIKKLKNSKYFQKLKDKKTEFIADLRIKYPESSMFELAEIVSKKLSQNVTKSNIMYVFNKLRKINSHNNKQI